jgi:hypothetical protein
MSQETESTDVGEIHPNPNKRYCPECATPINRKAKYCPSCGVDVAPEQDPLLSGRQWMAVGIFSALVSWVILAIIFSPIAMISGYKVFTEKPEIINGDYSELIGAIIFIIGFTTFFLWFSYMNSLYI